MWQSALDTYFRRPQLRGFQGLAGYVIGREKVGILFTRASAEGAEFTANETYVGEIDIPIHDIGDDVSGQVAAQFVGGDQQAEQVITFGTG